MFLIGTKFGPSRWLIESILQQFDSIHQRVNLDVTNQKEVEQEEKDARKERIRQSKENNSDEDNSVPISAVPEANLPISDTKRTVNIPPEK